MLYTVTLTKGALRDLKKLPRAVQVKLKPAIDALASDPRRHGSEKLTDGPNLYRVREGDYRILYQIQDAELVVLVVMLGDRADIYRRLKNL